MKHFLIAFVLFCTWLYFGIRYYECNVKNLCAETKVSVVVDTIKVIKEDLKDDAKAKADLELADNTNK